jgi:rubrerythrin
MSDEYTPTTDVVRDAYVRGMRQAFIASSGEHVDEFDRWLAEHDTEVRAEVIDWIEPHAWFAAGQAREHFGPTIRKGADRG